MVIDYSFGRQLVSDKYDQIMEWALSAINYYFSKNEVKWFSSYDKEAVMSNVSVLVFTKAELFNPEKSSLKTWVKTIAKNALVDYLRAHKDSAPIEHENEDGDRVMNPSAVETSSADASIGEAEIWDVLDNYLADRSSLDAQIMELTVAGFSVKEIAERFELTPNAVSMRLFKMRKELRPLLAA